MLHQLLEFDALLLELVDETVPLLELLLDGLELDRVGEGVLRLHDLLKLLAQASALIDVDLDLHFDLLKLGVADVLPECLYFFILLLALLVQVPYFALQVDHEMGLGLPPTSLGCRGEGLEVLGGLFVLLHDLLNGPVFAGEFDFEYLNARPEARVVLRQGVCGHLLLDHIVEQALAFLLHDPWSQLGHALHVEAVHRGRFGHRGRVP